MNTLEAEKDPCPKVSGLIGLYPESVSTPMGVSGHRGAPKIVP